MFPDEGPGFFNKANQITASLKYVEFLNRRLKGETGKSPAAEEGRRSRRVKSRNLPPPGRVLVPAF